MLYRFILLLKNHLRTELSHLAMGWQMLANQLSSRSLGQRQPVSVSCRPVNVDRQESRSDFM